MSECRGSKTAADALSRMFVNERVRPPQHRPDHGAHVPLDAVRRHGERAAVVRQSADAGALAGEAGRKLGLGCSPAVRIGLDRTSN